MTADRFGVRLACRRFRVVLRLLPVLSLFFLTACTEGGVVVSLRGEWRFTPGPPAFLVGPRGANGGSEISAAAESPENVILPGDLTERSGLAGRPGWITLRRQLPPEIDALLARGVPVSINVGQASDVYQIYLNETLAGGRGAVEPYEPGYFRTYVGDLPASAARAKNNTITIAIYTNGVYPVFVYGPRLDVGASKAVYATYYRGEIFVFVLLGIYFFIGAYHLLLVMRRPGELYNLYFGLFSIALAGYWFFSTELRGVVFGDAVIFGMLAEHLLVYNLTPLLVLFLSQLFYGRHSRIALGIAAAMLAISLVALFGTFAVQRMALSVWQLTIVPLMLYVVFYVFRAWRQGRPDAGLLAFGVLFFMTAGLHDVLEKTQGFHWLAQNVPGLPEYRPPGTVASYAFLLVVLGVAGILANRFARVHTEAERLNVELEDRVLERTRKLREAQRETDDILATVQEGLFLLYRAGSTPGSAGDVERITIGHQYSRELETVLRGQQIGGRDFIEMLRPMLITSAEGGDGSVANAPDNPEPDEVNAKIDSILKFLDLMFAGEVSAKMLHKVNPLRDIRLRLAPDVHRDLQFRFYRLQRDGQDVTAGVATGDRQLMAHKSNDRQLMAVVVDVTDQKELARTLQAEREKNEAERARLYAVLSADPVELAGFIRDCETELEQARRALERGDRDALFRSVHAMKGDAGMLDLQFFADRAHRSENLISGWRPELSAQSAEIDAALAGLAADLEDIRGDLARMRGFRENFGGDGGGDDQSGLSDPTRLADALARLTARMSARMRKSARLTANEKFLSEDARDAYARLPVQTRGVVREALIQLIRNSMAHGIEAPEERAERGKSREGEIALSLQAGAREVTIVLRDDGRGLDLERLRATARGLGRWTEAEMNAWTASDVAGLIFVPGLSTARETDGDAGRGVGMDLVRERVRGAGGRLEVRFAPGRYCEFRMRFPVAAV